jgi:hypothetical protein
LKIWNPQILASWVAGLVATGALKANLDVLNQYIFTVQLLFMNGENGSIRAV